MKKIILLGLAGCIFAGAQADQVATTTVQEEVPSNEQQIPDDTSLPPPHGNPFTGLYFGLGVGGNFYKNSFSGDPDDDGYRVVGNNVNRFLGFACVGGGKTFGRFYTGLEFAVDITSNKKATLHYAAIELDPDRGSIQMENKGVIPSIGIRLGYVNLDHNVLFYIKVSGSYARSHLDLGYDCVLDEENEYIPADAGTPPHLIITKDEIDYVGEHVGESSSSAIAPAIALGVEKEFGKKFSARFEGEYRFGSSKNLPNEEPGSGKYNKGFSVRAIVAYHVKLGA